MWPDWVKFCHFGTILKVFGISFWVILVFGTFFSLLWQKIMILGNFSLVEMVKYWTNQRINWLSGIQTCLVAVEGKLTDHLITTVSFYLSWHSKFPKFTWILIWNTAANAFKQTNLSKYFRSCFGSSPLGLIFVFWSFQTNNRYISNNELILTSVHPISVAGIWTQ